MIFGKEYDLSLWYMLKLKNLYGKKAIEFIKELPEEFLEHIRNVCNNDNVGLDNENDHFYIIPSNTDYNIYYKFYIMCGELFMYKIQTINGVERRLFSLILNKNDLDDIMNLTKDGDITLGSICTGHYPTINFNEVDYSLNKTEYGYVLTHNHVLFGNMIEIKSNKIIGTLDIPEELYRESSFQRRLLPPRNNDNK